MKDLLWFKLKATQLVILLLISVTALLITPTQIVASNENFNTTTGFGGITLGQSVSGTLYVTLYSDPSVTSLVKFYIDDTFINEEAASPYSLGGDTSGVVNGYDTRQLSNGPHTLKATLSYKDGQTQIQQIIFTVNNLPGPTPTCTLRPACSLPGANPVCVGTLPPGGSWCPIPTDSPVPTSACVDLNAVTNLTPRGNISVASDSAVFRWNSLTGATKYAIRIDDISDGFEFDYIAGDCKATSTNDTCSDNITTNSYSFPVQSGHSYRWWVHAISACDIWSAAASVNLTVVQPSATPVITNTPTPSPMAPTLSPTPTCSPLPSPICVPNGGPCTIPTVPPGGFCQGNLHPVDFTTQSVSLKADDFYIVADGKKFVGDQASLQLHSDPGNATYTTLEAIWQENGTEMRMFMYFVADKLTNKWWVFETRTNNGKNPANWNYFIKNSMESPLGTPFSANEYIINNVTNMATSDPHIYFRNLRVQAFTSGTGTLPPSVRFTYPVSNSPGGTAINGTSLDATYIANGLMTDVDHVHLILDSNPELRDLDFDGKHTITGLTPGLHTLKIYLAKADHTMLSNPQAQSTVQFTVQSPPVTISGTTCVKKPIGDADCNDTVDLLDFEAWRQEFTGFVTTKTADFDTSGTVDLADFESWRQGFIGQ